jgi:peroxiredoxin
MKRIAITLFLLATIVFAFAESSDQGSNAAINESAPDFTLKDPAGKEHSLSSYKGKFVVLEWVNLDCPFVKKHYNSSNMQKLQKKYTSKDVVWLSVCSSAKEKQGNLPADEIRKRLKKLKVSHTAYLIDESGAVGRLYGAKTTPHMFVIDQKGAFIYAGAIDDKPTTDAKDVEGAINYVSVALDEAMSGKDVSTPTTKSYGCSVKY